MKGIILAGGSGTRLYPLSYKISKQFLPVYDKPAFYYPLSVLMLAGIQDILIITTKQDLPQLRDVFGTGADLGLRLEYEVQDRPRGIADSFRIGAKFIGKDSVCLILGDNIFYGHDLAEKLLRASREHRSGARVFAYHVGDPSRYGIVEFDGTGKAFSITEKPTDPKSRWAVTGLYFYDSEVVSIAKSLKPSARGELEITDVNREYLDRGQLHVEQLGRGVAWLDVGTYDSLLAASQFVQTLESRQGLKVACVEEIAYRMGFIPSAQMKRLAERYHPSDYERYLLEVMSEQQFSGQKMTTGTGGGFKKEKK